MRLLANVFAWWAGQMAALIPAGWRRRERDSGDALLVDAGTGDGSVSLALRRRGREVPLGAVKASIVKPSIADAAGLNLLLRDLRPQATLLRLPPGWLLERMVILPAAAEVDLIAALAYEFDRFTPFAAEDAYWSAVVLHRDSVQRELQVRLSLVPKARLRPVVELLGAAGHPPTGLRVAAADGSLRRIGLATTAGHARRGLRAAVRVAGTVCALLAVAAAGLPIWQSYRALASIEAEIKRLQPQTAEVAALRRRIASRTDAGDVLGAEAARLGNVLGTIALLTGILPDDTYLTAMTMRQRRVTLTGQSADAARLIPRLSADPALGDVSFLAPVIRAASGRAELFSLRLELGR